MTDLDYGLTQTCNGTGWLICRCGGDACFCSRQGEAECFGCRDCEDSEQDYAGTDFESVCGGSPLEWCPVCQVWQDPRDNDGWGGCMCS